MIFNYQEEKQFEEALNPNHYPYLIQYFSRPDSRVTFEEVNDLDQQMRGVDIKLYTLDGAVLKVELKNDKHPNSPNLFLEDVSNSVSKSRGWTLKCEAEILSYGFCHPVTKKLTKLFVYDMRLMRRWYQKNRTNYPLKQIQNEGYETYGRPVPRADVEQFLLFKVDCAQDRNKSKLKKLTKLAQWI